MQKGFIACKLAFLMGFNNMFTYKEQGGPKVPGKLAYESRLVAVIFCITLSYQRCSSQEFLLLGTSILKINTSQDILLGLSKTFPPFFPLETIHSLQQELKHRNMLFEGDSRVLYSDRLLGDRALAQFRDNRYAQNSMEQDLRHLGSPCRRVKWKIDSLGMQMFPVINKDSRDR